MTPGEKLLWDIFANQAERSQMEIKQGRRKSFNIEFVEVTAENLADVALWGGGVVGDDEGVPFVRVIDKNAINTRQTKAFVGDFVVHHLELDTFKTFSKKAFSKSYEETREQTLRRDSATGEIVTEQYVDQNPETTTVEHMTVTQHGARRTATVPASEVSVATDGVDPKSLGSTELPQDAGLS